jgi:hypothetical protein
MKMVVANDDRNGTSQRRRLRSGKVWRAASLVTVALALIALLPFAPSDAQARRALQIEVGTIPGVTTEWQTFSLTSGYESLVVVATVQLPSPDSPPVVARIRNAGSTSFDIRLQNPSDEPVGPLDVSFFAAEAGTYTQATDGITMEVVLVKSSETARRGQWKREERTYANRYENPVVFGQVMTYNDPSWSAFWSSAATSRSSPATSTSFAAGKHVGEDPRTERVDEVLGYIVVEAGRGFMAGTQFEAGLGSDTITGVDNRLRSYELTSGFLPVGAALSSAGIDGGNGGWPVLIGDDPLTLERITAAIDEDQTLDQERSHTHEQLSYIVFGDGF